MIEMSRREKYVSLAVYAAVATLGTMAVLVYERMPDVVLVITSGITVAAFGTALWIASATPAPEIRPNDRREEQMRTLLEDATRLRAQTEKLHRDLVSA
ncbi:MAG: hypothetical protein M3271_09370, partial [Actinomycetota bacterium]|nr:hypothetical protein [Actinomycetota bacterium]